MTQFLLSWIFVTGAAFLVVVNIVVFGAVLERVITGANKHPRLAEFRPMASAEKILVSESPVYHKKYLLGVEVIQFGLGKGIKINRSIGLDARKLGSGEYHVEWSSLRKGRIRSICDLLYKISTIGLSSRCLTGIKYVQSARNGWIQSLNRSHIYPDPYPGSLIDLHRIPLVNSDIADEYCSSQGNPLYPKALSIAGFLACVGGVFFFRYRLGYMEFGPHFLRELLFLAVGFVLVSRGFNLIMYFL